MPDSRFSSTAEEGAIEVWCKNQLEADENLTNFRPMPFVDTFGPDLGWKFVSYITRHYPKFLGFLDVFRKGDSLGNPSINNFGILGDFSPNILRYIKIAGDLEKIYGSLQDKTIVEIGGGYGGQCYIISALFPFKEYILIDLPAVVELQKRYLDILGVQNVRFYTHNQLPTEVRCDLLISNYAFSECSKNMQMEYLEKVLKYSKSGYMICNDYGWFNQKSFRSAFERCASYLQFFPEEPQTGSYNYTIIWKQ